MNQPVPNNPTTDLEEEITVLFAQQNDQLVGYLRMKLGDVQEANDVAQEAFIKLLALDPGRKIANIKAYLFRTASNLAVDRLRARKRRASTEPIGEHVDKIPDLTSDVHAELESRGSARIVAAAFLELPKNCQHAFRRYRFDRASYKEIAQEMSISESMVRKHVLRAMRHCAEKLERS